MPNYRPPSMAGTSSNGLNVKLEGNLNAKMIIYNNIYIIIINLEFEPLFAMFTKSRYADKYVMKADMTQQSALMESNNEAMCDTVYEDDEHTKTLNPCEFGFLLHGLRTSMQNIGASYSVGKCFLLYRRDLIFS